MIETISIQSIWSPPGKEFPKVITTPEQVKYHLYTDQSELSSHFKVGSEATIDCYNTTNRQGKEIRRIQNVVVDGQPIIQQTPPEPSKGQTPEIAPQERGMWWKELGECIRAKVFTKDTPEGFAARAAYFAEMFRVLNIKVEKPSKTS